MSGGKTGAPRRGGGDGTRAWVRAGVVERHGATLVEVLVALVLLAVGALAAAGLMSLGVGLVGEARMEGERMRALVEVHDSLVVAEAVEPGVREAAGDTLRWRPVSEGDELWVELVVPAGSGADADTFRVLGQAYGEGP